MNAPTVVGCLIATYAVQAILEKAFDSSSNGATLRKKIRAVFDRIVPKIIRTPLYVLFWQNLPYAILLACTLTYVMDMSSVDIRARKGSERMLPGKKSYDETVLFVASMAIVLFLRAFGAQCCKFLRRKVYPSYGQLSIEYSVWRENAIQTKVYPLFQKFLQDSDILSQFLCDINQDLISNPVRTPNGKVYERSAIEAWLSKKAIEYPPDHLAAMSPEDRQDALLSFCPRRSCHLTPDLLVPDFDYHRRVALALKPLFERQLNEQFKQGLLNYQIAFLKDRESLIRETIKDVAAKFSSGQISENDFLAACRECKAHYGIPQ